MGDLGDGWQMVFPTSHSGIERLSRSHLESYEHQILKEWESSRGHWSGTGKHTPASDFTEAKKLHPRFKPATDKVLGSGTYGVVEKVTYSHNNRSICLARKWIQYRRGRTIQMLREEANVMEKLDHEHIVKLVGTYSVRHNELYLLLWPVAVCNLDNLFNDIDSLRTEQGDRDDILKRLEVLDLKNLGAVERKRHKITQPSANQGNCPLRYLQQIMGCIAHAVAYCHEADIRHLDLKPSNILVNPGRVYLADFGIARDVHDRDHTMTFGIQGTPKWRAPEILNPNDEWSMKDADTYSLGLVFLNIATILYGGSMAEFDHVLDDTTRSRAEKLRQYHVKLETMALATQALKDVKAHSFAPKHVLDLTSRMLSPKPSDRPRANQVDVELVDLGGIEQVYHLPCCKKGSRFVTERIDMRYKMVVDERDRLVNEHEMIAKRLAVLEGKDETYESRIKNERKAHEKNILNLQQQLEIERIERKRLEALLRERKKQQQRPGIPQPGRKILVGSPMPTRRAHQPVPVGAPLAPPSRPTLSTQRRPPSTSAAVPHSAGPAYSQAASSESIPQATSITRRPGQRSTQQKQQPPSPPSPPAVNASINGSLTTKPSPSPSPSPNPNPNPTPNPVPSPSPSPAGYTLRNSSSGSRLPRLVNPSTPIRCNTPIPLQRDLSLTDSSVASSIFSRVSNRSRDSETAIASPLALGISPVVMWSASKDADPPVAERKKSVQDSTAAPGRPADGQDVALGLGLRYDDATTRKLDNVKDTASIISSGADASGTMSPGLSRSAMSSPRAPKAELLESINATGVRVPPLPTAKSWADVARRIEKRV